MLNGGIVLHSGQQYLEFCLIRLPYVQTKGDVSKPVDKLRRDDMYAKYFKELLIS